MVLVADTHFAPGDVTVSAQIETMRAGNPQAVVSWATTAAGATVFRGMKQAGMDLPTAASASNMTVQQMTDYAPFLPQQVFFGAGEWAANGDPRLDVPAEIATQQKLFFSSMKAVGIYPGAGEEIGWEPIRVVADALNKLPAGGRRQAAARLSGELAGPCRRRGKLRFQEDAAARPQHRQRHRRPLGFGQEGVAPRQQPEGHADRMTSGKPGASN
jgi:branched-chain amino acid transport system substrate-binding protein